MANDSWIGAGSLGQNLTVGSGARAFSLYHGAPLPVTNGSFVNAKARAGTFDKLSMYIMTSTGGNERAAVGIRLNNVNQTSLVANQTAGVTGRYEDTTHSQAVSNGDLVSFWCDDLFGSGSTSTGGMIAIRYQGTAALTNIMGAGGNTSFTYSGTATQYCRIMGGRNSAPASTESQAQGKVRAVGTAMSLHCFLDSNSKAGTTNVTLRLNGVNQALTIAIGSTATGLFDDTTHTVALADGDLASVGLSTANAGDVQFRTISMIVEASASQWDMMSGRDFGASNGSTSNTYHVIIGDPVSGSTTEAQTQGIIRFNTTAQKLRIKVKVSGSGLSPSRTLRINGVNGNNTITATANTTGWFEDTTHTDSLVSGDLINYFAPSQTSGSTETDVQITMGAGAVVPTADIFQVLGGLTQDLVGNVEHTSGIFQVLGQLTQELEGEALADVYGTIGPQVLGGLVQTLVAYDLGSGGGGGGVRQFWTF